MDSAGLRTTPRARAGARAVDWRVLCAPGTHPYWLELVAGSGLPIGTTTQQAEPDVGGSLLFLPEGLPRDASERRRIEDLWRRGAPIVGDGRTAAALTGGEVRAVRGFGVTGPAPLFDGPIRTATTTVFAHANANLGRIWPTGDAAVAVLTDGPAPVIALPLADGDRLVRSGGRMTAFAVSPEQSVAQYAAATDHGALRRWIEAAFRELSFGRGLPFAKLAGTPDGIAPGGCLRVEAPSRDEAAATAALRALDDAGLRATWFVDVESHGGELITAIASAGHEVHPLVSSGGSVDAAGAHRALQELGVESRAIALNHGQGLADDSPLRAQGVRWTSEYGRICDDLPSQLPGPTPAEVLAPDPWQVPVHPVTPRALRRQGFDANAITEYFARLARTGNARGEVVVVRAHQADVAAHHGWLDALSADQARWQPTMNELWRFHVERRRQQPSVSMSGEGMSGSCDGPIPMVVEGVEDQPQTLRGRFWLQFAPNQRDALAGMVGRPIPAGAGPDMPELWCEGVAAKLRRMGRRRRWRQRLNALR